MANSPQEIKRRIGAVRTTKKITKAMQLVATSKLRKALQEYQKRKDYTIGIYDVVHSIIQKTKSFQLTPSTGKNNLYIVINSDLGLCGGFNGNLNRYVESSLNPGDGVILIGKKAEGFYKTKNATIEETYYRIGDNITFTLARNIGIEALTRYQSNQYGKVFICCNKYINSVKSEPQILQILPIEKPEIVEDNTLQAITIFEPDAETVFKSLLPFYINSVVYGVLIESKVAEFSSRRTAMENASDNADDIEENLQLIFNRVRQSAITREISEIVSGSNAGET